MYCGKCGSQVPDGYEYCMKCGTKIDKQQVLSENETVASNASEVKIDSKKPDKKKNKTIIISVISVMLVVACVVLYFVMTKVVIPNNNYNAAITLMNNGEYDAAISAFEALNGYKDSAEQIKNCEIAIQDNNYDAAVALMDSEDYEAAITAFEALDGYKDSADMILECKYDAALALMNGGDYTEAITAFEALGDYKDSVEQIANCEMKSASIGSSIYFGTYEQDNNTSNGAEDIEWIVLDKEDTRILVISKYILDAQPYNSYKNYDWDTCTLREWLNGTFLNTAFSQEEAAQIETVKTDEVSNTQDQVFLLDLDQKMKYARGGNSKSMAVPTDYAFAQGSDSVGEWWVRPAGVGNKFAAIVEPDGDTIYNPSYIRYDFACGVRPAIWISLE